MTAKRTYKPWIGAFLLIMYAFIATPVQFWHQHKIVVNHSDSTGKSVVSKQNDKAVDTSCQVCSHHYSAYANNTHTLIAIPVVHYAINESSCTHSFPAEPYFHTTGRGPPAG